MCACLTVAAEYLDGLVRAEGRRLRRQQLRHRRLLDVGLRPRERAERASACVRACVRVSGLRARLPARLCLRAGARAGGTPAYGLASRRLGQRKDTGTLSIAEFNRLGHASIQHSLSSTQLEFTPRTEFNRLGHAYGLASRRLGQRKDTGTLSIAEFNRLGHASIQHSLSSTQLEFTPRTEFNRLGHAYGLASRRLRAHPHPTSCAGPAIAPPARRD